jgi:nickel/cobalt transporter (NicO) family protein
LSGNGPAILAAAAGVAVGHAILPDHWVPLALLGRTRRYPLARVARLSGLAGIAHVLVSVVLGGVIIAVGLQFRSAIEHAEGSIVGGLLIATGIGFLVFELTGHGHSHSHDHGDTDDHDRHQNHGHAGHDRAAPPPGRLHGLAAVMVPFGAAASPDLTILPVFLAAAAIGTATAIGSVVIFAAVTIGTIVGLTLTATRGGYEIRGQWLERWGNALTALVLIGIGALVLTGVI